MRYRLQSPGSGFRQNRILIPVLNSLISPSMSILISISHSDLSVSQVLQYLTGVVDDGVKTEVECGDGEECEEKSLTEQQSECLARNQGQQVFKYNFFTGKPCYNETGTNILSVSGFFSVQTRFLPNVFQYCPGSGSAILV